MQIDYKYTFFCPFEESHGSTSTSTSTSIKTYIFG